MKKSVSFGTHLGDHDVIEWIEDQHQVDPEDEADELDAIKKTKLYQVHKSEILSSAEDFSPELPVTRQVQENIQRSRQGLMMPWKFAAIINKRDFLQEKEKYEKIHSIVSEQTGEDMRQEIDRIEQKVVTLDVFKKVDKAMK